MKIRINLFVAAFIFFMVTGNPVFSQERKPIFNLVSPPDGTSWGFITGITQDPKGFLWLSSLHGLFKYDGYRFTQYLSDPLNPNSLGGDWTECVYADPQGIIWIGNTDHGSRPLRSDHGRI